MSTTLGDIRSEWRQRARELSIDPREIDLLIASALSRTTAWVFGHEDYSLAGDELQRTESMLRRRLQGEPSQYVRGTTEFYGREFRVDERALIPRPETETIVEQILERVPDARRVLDLCTGSGCIGITIALERPDIRVDASDISLAALALARSNAAALDAAVRFVASDVLDGLSGTWDAIGSNPPYIPAYEMPGLQREIRNFEPHLALTPGDLGTEITLRMLRDAHRVLRPGGLMVSEMGWNQSERIRVMAVDNGWEVVAIEQDLSGTLRCSVLRRPTGS